MTMEKLVELNFDSKIASDLILFQNASKIYYQSNNDNEFFSEEFIDKFSLTDDEFDELSDKLKVQLNSLNLSTEQKEFINKLIFGITYNGENIEISKLPIINETVMISLNKLKFDELKSRISSELRKHFIKNGDYIPGITKLFISPKLDGMAIKIVLDDNSNLRKPKLIMTRGGLNVTEKLINHPDIVRTTNNSLDNIIHGELVIDKRLFNDKYKNGFEDEVTYANPRNFVAGKIKSNNPSVEIINDFRFIPYSNGINPIGTIWHEINENNLISLQNIFNQEYKNNNYPFLVDGLVIGFNTSNQKIEYNYPLNMVAIKFKSISAKTKIIKFDWTVKKSGNIWPVAIVEPIELDGSLITAANVYNYETIKKKKIGIGSEITITKSGDIIPVLDKVLSYSNNINLPTIDYIESGKHLKALNNEISREYKFILGLKVLNIDGIGDTLSEKIGELLDYNILEIFNPQNKHKLFGLLGNVTFQKFNAQVFSVKNLYLNQLIEMLQFNRCGKVLSEKFALIITGNKIDTKGIEYKVLEYVCKGEGFQKIQESIKYLFNLGIKVLKPIVKNEDTITFEMSNSPKSGITKEQFVRQFTILYPNCIHTTLTKDTKLLIIDDINSNTSKANKARKYNIKMITYEQALSEKL